MKSQSRIILGMVLGGLLLSTGCVKLWTQKLDIKTYIVETERTTAVLNKPLADKLWIDTVSVLPPFNVRNMVLRRSDVEYETSYYTELLLSPAENFRNNFYTWFAASGIFQEVSLANRREMSHRLAISVLKFYGDASVEQGQAVMEVKATLVDEQAKGLRVLFSKSYMQRVDLVERGPDELMRAYNLALSNILVECEKDMLSVLKQTTQDVQ
jgi:uncharacterized lipoprotein YmbA